MDPRIQEFFRELKRKARERAEADLLRARAQAWESSKRGAARLGAAVANVRAYLESPEFEGKLDFLLERRLEKELRADPDLQAPDRRIRVQRKLLALARKYGQQVAAASALGAEIGAIFGPGAEINVAALFGGVQVTVIVGEVVYVFAFRPGAAKDIVIA